MIRLKLGVRTRRAGSRRNHFTKEVGLPERLDPADDSLPAWMERYLDLAVRGVRSPEVTAKISRHLERFGALLASSCSRSILSANGCTGPV
ncbi:hypothetical protein ACWGH8_26260 [Nonomuraea muscovyensis]